MTRAWTCRRFVVILPALAVFAGGALAQPLAREDETGRHIDAFLVTFNEQFSAGNLDGWMALWAEDSERRTSTEHQRGKAQVRAAYEALYARNAELRLFNEHRRVAQRTTVVWEGETAGVHRATGRSFKLPIVAIVDFTSSGLVRSAHFYLDTGFLARQLSGDSVR